MASLESFFIVVLHCQYLLSTSDRSPEKRMANLSLRGKNPIHIGFFYFICTMDFLVVDEGITK